MQSESIHLRKPIPKPPPEILHQWSIYTKPKVKNAAYTKYCDCKTELDLQKALKDARKEYPHRIVKVEEIHVSRRVVIER